MRAPGWPRRQSRRHSDPGAEGIDRLALHPLNQGIAADINAAIATGRLRPEVQQSGLRFWLGLCQVLMSNAIERRIDRAEAARRLEDMLVLALTGLGLSATDAAGHASASAEAMRLGH